MHRRVCRLAATRFAGREWRAYICRDEDSAYVSAIDQAYAAVKACILGDFHGAVPPTEPVDIIVAHAPEDIRAGLETLHVSHLFKYRARGGCHLAGLGVVLIFLPRTHRGFVRCLHHELCHALCESALGGGCRNVWAREGYAALVGARCCGPEAVSGWRESLLAAPPGARLLTLGEVLRGRARARRQDLDSRYLLQARVLVAFLYERRVVAPRVWNACQRALADDIGPRQVIRTLEREFQRKGTDLDLLVWGRLPSGVRDSRSTDAC